MNYLLIILQGVIVVIIGLLLEYTYFANPEPEQPNKLEPTQARLEAEKRRLEQALREAEAEKRRLEQELREAEAEKRRLEQARRKAEAEKRRLEQACRKAEAERRRLEEACCECEVNPAQFIRNYYTGISNQQYNKTWSMLSYNFKKRFHWCYDDGSCDPDNYLKWWNTISRVEVLKVNVLEQYNNTAKIKVKLRYFKKNGRVVDENHTFQLIKDATTNNWLINQSGK